MKMMLVAGLLITLPALAVLVAVIGEVAMIPVLASIGVAALPFIVGAWLIARGKSDDEKDLHAGGH